MKLASNNLCSTPEFWKKSGPQEEERDGEKVKERELEVGNLYLSTSTPDAGTKQYTNLSHYTCRMYVAQFNHIFFYKSKYKYNWYSVNIPFPTDLIT